MIVAVPTDTPLIRPLTLLIVATPVLLLVQVPPITALLNVVVAPLQIEKVPVIAESQALTVSVFVAWVPQPVL